MEKFAERYHTCNAALEGYPFANAQTAYVLAYSVIMLNTDQHNPTIKKRMSVDDFVKNNRGIDDEKDIDRAWMVALYERIKYAAGRRQGWAGSVRVFFFGAAPCTELRAPAQRHACAQRDLTRGERTAGQRHFETHPSQPKTTPALTFDLAIPPRAKQIMMRHTMISENVDAAAARDTGLMTAVFGLFGRSKETRQEPSDAQVRVRLCVERTGRWLRAEERSRQVAWSQRAAVPVAQYSDRKQLGSGSSPRGCAQVKELSEFLKEKARGQQFYVTTDPDALRPLVAFAWEYLLPMLSTFFTDSADQLLTNECLAGLVAASCLACAMGIRFEATAFINTLAKFTCLHEPGTMQVRGATGFATSLAIHSTWVHEAHGAPAHVSALSHLHSVRRGFRPPALLLRSRLASTAARPVSCPSRRPPHSGQERSRPARAPLRARPRGLAAARQLAGGAALPVALRVRAPGGVGAAHRHLAVRLHALARRRSQALLVGARA